MKSTILHSIIFSVAFAIFVQSSSASDTVIAFGNGNNCVNNAALDAKGNPLKATALTKQINKLKSAAKKQSRKGKKKTLKKINALKALKKLVVSCTEGKLVNLKAVDPLFKSLVGTYFGGYAGQSTLTGNVGGDMLASFALDGNGTFFTANFSFDGLLGSLLGNGNLSFQHDVQGFTFPAEFTVVGNNIGTVTLKISSDGTIEVYNVGSPVVLYFRGMVASSTLTGEFQGTYSEINFSGNFSLVK